MKKLFILILLSMVVFSACSRKTIKEKVSYEGIELTYYKVFDDSDVIEPIINEYTAAHPGLKIHYKKFSDFDEYQKTILNEMAEGEGPDIFSMPNTWFTSNYRKLTPLPERFGDPAGFESEFVDVASQDLVRTDDDGALQIYALPMTVDTLALYYNKDHFEDRIPSQGKPSKTWEGIKEDVEKLNKEDNSFGRFEVSAIAMGRADNITRAVDILYLLFQQFDARIYNDNLSEAIFAGRQGGATSYPGTEALEFFTSFADEDEDHYSWNEFVVDDDSDGKEVEAFAAGEVSMILGYSYTYDDILNQRALLTQEGIDSIDKSAIRIAPVPQLFDPETAKEKRVTYASYFAETVSRNTEHADIAWDFLLELTSKGALEYYFDKTHKPTSRRDMIEDQKKHPTFGVFASQIGFSESFPIIDYYIYKDLFTDVINQFADGNTIDKRTLIDAQKRISGMLPEEGLVVPEVIDDNE
ncbi:extracellular solute-binding protein [Candidatus Gracilibacteria bacterium]|nr:extracellular solute-binding protein [Candidatus Gracilibacteria bacterium]